MSHWNNKRVVVTGGSGFLGSVLVRKLRNLGAGVSAPGSSELDLRSMDAVESLYRENRPDVVFHLAASCGGIGANLRNPGKYFYDNAIMGIQMIEAARRHAEDAGRPDLKLVIVGTICAYPRDTPVPFREEALWDGYPEATNAPYGLAKKMLLVQSEAYRRQYGLNSIYLLPVNLYGPGDNFDLEDSHVIAALVRKMVEARRAKADSVQAWGSGRVSREFFYVDDCAEGLLLAGERYNQSEPVNLGAGREVTIRELAEMIRSLTRFEGRIEWDSSRPDGQPRRCLDTSRAREAFGFSARTPLEQGLRQTIGWYEQQASAGSPPAGAEAGR